MKSTSKLKDYNKSTVDNKYKLQIEIQEQILTKLKQLEESSLLIDSLKSLNIKNKCLNSNTLSSTRSGPYGYLPGLIGYNESSNSKLVQFGELGLLVFILFLWIVSIIVCLNRYSKLRTLYPVFSPHTYNTKGPMHIEEIKIIKNEQDAVIYKKARTSQATISRALKSSSAISATNTTSSLRDPKFKRSFSEPNALTNAENTTVNLIQKNSNKYSQSTVRNGNITSSINNNNNIQMNATNNPNNPSPSLSIDASRINILHKANRTTYFSIDNYKLPKCQESIFKRHNNDPRIISMKRSLFAKSKVNLFKTKDSLTSNNESNYKNSLRSNKSNISGSLNRADTPNKQVIDSCQADDNSRMTIQDDTHLLAPNWLSQTTIEKIRENLMDLHTLIRLERRPSLLQLSKISSKSESNIKANKKSNEKLTVNETLNEEQKKPISLSLQNPNRSNKRFDFV